MTRELQARVICRRITNRIGEFSPPGLGHWDRAWDLVEVPSHRFLDALDAWTQDGTPSTQRAVQDAADVLLVAWADAGDLFRLLEGSRMTDHAHV